MCFRHRFAFAVRTAAEALGGEDYVIAYDLGGAGPLAVFDFLDDAAVADEVAPGRRAACFLVNAPLVFWAALRCYGRVVPGRFDRGHAFVSSTPGAPAPKLAALGTFPFALGGAAPDIPWGAVLRGPGEGGAAL